MAKNDLQQVKSNANAQQQNTNSQYNATNATNAQRSTDQYNQGQQQQGQLWNNYSNLASTGGLNGSLVSGMKGVNLPGGANPPSGPSSGSQSSPNMTSTGGGDFGSKLDALYSKYGKSDTGSGSGITDKGYWGSTALNNAGGDQDYVLQRLESDLQGKGPDQGGGGSGGSGDNPFAEADPFARDLASTGGVDMNKLMSTAKDYQAIKDNPFDPTAKANIAGDTANFRSMEQTGGLSDADKNNFLGNGVFKNMSETGGFSPEQANLYRQRATAMVPAMYQQMADQMQRRKAVQGGYAPGFSAGQALLSRTANSQMNDATRGAENDLQTQIRSNKMAGAQGLSTGQGAFSGLQTSNRLAATQGAASTEMAVQDAINRYKMAAIGGETGVNQTAEQLAQQGKIAGTGLLTAAGTGMNNANIANMETTAANQRYVLGAGQQGLFNANSGLSNLYGTSVNQGMGYGSQNLSGISGQAGGNQGYLGTLEDNAKATPGLMDYISRSLGMVGGVIPGVSNILSGAKTLLPKSSSGGYSTPNFDNGIG